VRETDGRRFLLLYPDGSEKSLRDFLAEAAEAHGLPLQEGFEIDVTDLSHDGTLHVKVDGHLAHTIEWADMKVVKVDGVGRSHGEAATGRDGGDVEAAGPLDGADDQAPRPGSPGAV
jgi:hypothetical protein